MERQEGNGRDRKGGGKGEYVCVPEIDSFLLPYIIHYTNNL